MSPTDSSPEVEVAPYREPLREDFARLNRQWIEEHFRLEQADLDSFADPHAAFVAPGGEVFFTLVDGRVLGTCALRKESEDTYELCKMAVAPEARGRGLGDVLIRAVIDAARARGHRDGPHAAPLGAVTGAVADTAHASGAPTGRRRRGPSARGGTLLPARTSALQLHSNEVGACL